MKLFYRGYTILDGSDLDFLNAPRILVLGHDLAFPIGRFDTLKQAMEHIDKLLHKAEFESEFEEFLNDKKKVEGK